MKFPFQSKRTSSSRLREAINFSSASEALYSIPDRLADIIERYDGAPADPHFRHDIYNILAGGIDIAEAMVDETFSVEDATQQISRQMEVLSRLLNYFNRRPQRTGFSILIPATHQLIGQFGTEQEAQSHLDAISQFGSPRNSIVVPVKVISQHAIQPRPVELTRPEPPEDDPIPAGVQPTKEPLIPDPPAAAPLQLTSIEDRVSKAEADARAIGEKPQ